MRTRNWLLALSVTAIPASFLGACGDSGDGTGGANAGGAGVTATTGVVTVGSTTHASTTHGSTTVATTGVTTGVTTNVSSSTTGSTTNSSTSTGAMDFENCTDAMMAQAIPLTVPGSFQTGGTTMGSTDSFHEFCPPGGTATTAPDVVYKFTTTMESTFTASLAEIGAWNGVLELRKTCSDPRLGDYQCFDSATSGETLPKRDLPAGTYYVVVDGSSNADSGMFNLSLSAAGVSCGDGVINSGAGETCDPPNNGGCDSVCHLTPTTAPDTCAQAALAPIAIVAPANLFLPVPPAGPFVDDDNAADDYTPVTTAACPWNFPVGPLNKAPDQVFDIHTGASVGGGVLTVEIGLEGDGMTDACQDPNVPSTCWNTGVFIRSACTDQTAPAQLACGIEGTGNSGAYTVTVNNVTPNTDYYVFVKSNDSDHTDPYRTGPYFLKIGLN